MADAPTPADGPEPQPERGTAATVSEGAPQDARNGMAVAALVVGILAVIPCPIGILFAVSAVVLGILALVRARHLPAPHDRAGMGFAGVFLGGASLTVWIVVLVPAVAHARGIAQRAACAANQRGVWQGCHIYANDNQGWFPIKMYHEAAEDAGDKTPVSFVGQMGAYRTTPLNPLPPGADVMNRHFYADPNTPDLTGKQNSVHPSQSMFLLVIDGTFTAKQFICPSSGDTEDDLRDQGAMVWDFRGYSYLSYGYQLPFGRMGKPSENLDPRMALLADKGPYFQAGTPRSDGTVPDQAVGTPGRSITVAGVATEAQLSQGDPTAWRPYNSRNHGSEGQNVLFVDGHVEWVKKPIVGVDHDNIYTVQGPGYTALDALLGRTPADKMGPFTDTDSVIVP